MKLYRSDIQAFAMVLCGLISGTIVYTHESHELGVALWAGHAVCALAIFLRGDYLMEVNATLHRRSTRRRYLTLFLCIAAIVCLVAGVFSWCWWWLVGFVFVISLIVLRVIILWTLLTLKLQRRKKEKRFSF